MFPGMGWERAGIFRCAAAGEQNAIVLRGHVQASGATRARWRTIGRSGEARCQVEPALGGEKSRARVARIGWNRTTFCPPADYPFAETCTLSMENSASLELPNMPGLPIVLGVASVASTVQAAGSRSPRGQTLPRKIARPSEFSLRNFMVYHLPASQRNGTVLANRSSRREAHERI